MGGITLEVAEMSEADVLDVEAGGGGKVRTRKLHICSVRWERRARAELLVRQRPLPWMPL